MKNRPLRVLIIDDSQELLDGLQSAFADYSDRLEVAGTAADAETGLEMLRELDVDMVLLDMRLPGIDGVAAARIAHLEKPDVPVVLMSATDSAERHREGIAAGAAAVLSKDGDVATLVSRMIEVGRGGGE